LGNLNFTFIMHKEIFDLTKQLEVILRAVRKLGVDAEFSGRNDLTVEGKKFSGNAFYHGNISSYHHGTILINTDAQKLAKFLQVSKEKIISKGIDSVQARVINLHSLEPGITVDTMISSLKESFSELYGGAPHAKILDTSALDVHDLYNKYASWEWRYGQTPKFDFLTQKQFPWGSIEMGLTLKDGRISSATIYSDAMNSDLILKLASWLEGLPFQMDVLANCLASRNSNLEDRAVLNDIQQWLLSD
jgi:lipoate-protein ligase A